MDENVAIAIPNVDTAFPIS